MISGIKDGIDKIESYNTEKKELLFDKLKDGFIQIKQNIWVIFVGIVLVIIFSILKDTINPFGWKVEKYQIPDIANITLFILATLSMYDIMRTMFNLSEINLLLIKKNK